MTYGEFYEAVKATYSKIEKYPRYTKKGKIAETETYRHWPHGDEHNFVVEWETGGASGGNCWGDEAHSYHCDGPEPDLELSDLFEKVCPNMTFLQYRSVMKDVLVHSTRSDSEYYGNYTDYGVKSVNYRTLYNRLVERNVIDGD